MEDAVLGSLCEARRHLELAALEARNRLERGLDGVPLEAVEEVAPLALQVVVHTLVQQHLEVLDVHRVALSRQTKELRQKSLIFKG